MSSFRLRLGLLSGAITGLLLLGGGAYAWRLTLRFNLDRLDRELRNLGAANLDRVVGDEHWRRVDGALRFVSGPDRPPGFALWVENHGREIYLSPHWPEGLPRPGAGTEPLTYEGGLRLGTPPRPPRNGEQISPRNPALPRREARFETLRANGGTWRVAHLGNPYVRLVLAANIDEFNAEVDELGRMFLLGLPVALLLAGGGAWFLAGRALRPVEELTRAAERVTARGLDQRITGPGRDREFERLVTVFNQMMERLENSFHQATRFSADASHELKTPLARLQAELEQALAAAAPGSPEQQACSSLLEEVQRLKAVVQRLLLLALADAGRLDSHREQVDLSQIVSNVAEDCAALSGGVALESEVAAGVRVAADPVLLEQAVQNLASNAIRYNRPGGRVRLGLHVEAGRAVLRVGNTGPGISAEDRGRVFERFFRGDRARGARGGAGLGLSLSREILRAQGGELELEPAAEDWTVFRATLPVGADPPAA